MRWQACLRILLFLSNSSIVDFYGWREWKDHKIGHKYMTPKLVIFYDVQISRIQEKIHHMQGQRPFIKCAHRKRVCRMILVRMHMNYLFPNGNENVHPILNNYENEMIRISLHTSHFSLKGAALSSELLIYFKYNNHIQDRKLALEKRSMNVMIT